jgi:hypothetical protein
MSSSGTRSDNKRTGVGGGLTEKRNYGQQGMYTTNQRRCDEVDESIWCAGTGIGHGIKSAV